VHARLGLVRRFADAIRGLARAVLKRFAEKGSGMYSGLVAEGLIVQLGRMHERLGLAPLVLRPASNRGRAKKAAAG
jgi:hypothetical protein